MNSFQHNWIHHPLLNKITTQSTYIFQTKEFNHRKRDSLIECVSHALSKYFLNGVSYLEVKNELSGLHGTLSDILDKSPILKRLKIGMVVCEHDGLNPHNISFQVLENQSQTDLYIVLDHMYNLSFLIDEYKLLSLTDRLLHYIISKVDITPMLQSLPLSTQSTQENTVMIEEEKTIREKEEQSVPLLPMIKPEPSTGGSIFTIKVRGGIKWDVVKSGIQKGIRRGRTDLSVPLTLRALELGQSVKAAFTNLTNRIIITSVEDIGPASLSTLFFVDRYITELRDNKDSYPITQVYQIASFLIHHLCVEKKTRYISWLRNYFITCILNKPIYGHLIISEIHDIYSTILSTHPNSLIESWKLARQSKYPYITLAFAQRALDTKDVKSSPIVIWKQPTFMGDVVKKKNKNAEGIELTEDKQMWEHIYEQTSHKELIKLLYKWYITNNEKHIFFIMAHILWIEPERCRHDLDKTVPSTQEYESWNTLAFYQPINIPDYVYDWHTKQGKLQGADLISFAKVGSQINNEMKSFQTTEYADLRQKYIDAKIIQQEQLSKSTSSSSTLSVSTSSSSTSSSTSSSSSFLLPFSNQSIQENNNNNKNNNTNSNQFPTSTLTSEYKHMILHSNAIHGQVLTAGHKPITYIMHEGILQGKVFKGPYSQKSKIQTLWNRYQGFKWMKCDVIDIEVYMDGMNYWVCSNVFAVTFPSFWKYEVVEDKLLHRQIRRLIRTSLGTSQISRLSTDEEKYDILFGPRFLLRDYLVAAVMGCGDQGLHNALIELKPDPRAVLIDYEDSTTRSTMSHLWDIFVKPSNQLKTIIETGYKNHKEKIMHVWKEIQAQEHSLRLLGALDETQFKLMNSFFSTLS